MYDNGRRVISYGFYTKALAESWRESFERDLRVAADNKTLPGISWKVEEARGWSVDGVFFADFNDALRYAWEKHDGRGHMVRGVF